MKIQNRYNWGKTGSAQFAVTKKSNLHNRLVHVVQTNPKDGGTPVNVSYEYDGLNHRISRTGTNNVKSYGRNCALAMEKTGARTRSYVYTNGVIAGFVDSDGTLTEIRYCITTA